MAQATSRPFPGSRRLDTLCYLLVWTGAGALLLVPKAAPQLVLAFCLVIAPSRFLSVPAQKSATYRTVWRVSTLAFIVVSLLECYWTGRPLFQTLIAQMCFFQTCMAYNSKNYWDYLLMALLATAMVVFCALESSSVFFLLILVPFVAILGAFLLSLNLSRQYLVSPAKRGATPAGTTAAPVGYQVALKNLSVRDLAVPSSSRWFQTLAVLSLGAAIFYVLPRDRAFLPSHLATSIARSGRGPALSGLAGGVDLRHLSAIKRDPRQVVRVVFPARVPPPEAIYLRSGALERLSNLQWYPLPLVRPHRAKPDDKGAYWFQHVEPADRPLLIPHLVEFLSAAGQVSRPLALPGLVAVDQVETRPPDRRIGVVGWLTSLKRYRAFSWGIDGPSRSTAASEEDHVWSECLNLPSELATRSLFVLASDFAYGHDGHLEQAKAIERRLHSRYGYTLDIEPLDGPADGSNPIEKFLCDHRRGNCEVFASAMVVLCRNLGIPSRLAIGYRGGIQGDSPNEFIFRNQDSHAWVEVWSPQRGWVTFDPTPPPPLEVYSGRFSFKKLMEWFGSVTSRWNRFVVFYDRDAKARWATRLWGPLNDWAGDMPFERAALARLMMRVRENISRPQIGALLVGLVGVNIAAAVFYLQARRRWPDSRRRGTARARRADPWQKFYRLAVAALRGKVRRRRPAQTPGEFLQMLANGCALDPTAIRPIVELYHRGRFGGASWDEQAQREAELLLQRLAHSVKSR